MLTRILVLAALAVFARAESAGGTFSNTRWGYKLRVPAKWEAVGLDKDESTIASRHLSPKGLRPKRSLWVDTKPELTVFGFPHGKERRDALEAYRARVDRPGAGAARIVKDKTKGGIRRLELRQDGVATPPTRLIVWIRPFDDIDFVLEGRVLEDYVDSYRKLYERCFKSFARIEREHALPGAGGESALSDAEREIEALPEGWRHVRTDHYLILSNASPKFTSKTAKHAEAMRRYLDATFQAFGGEAPPEGVIRVFSDAAQEMAYRRKAADLLFAGNEVLVAEGDSYGDFNFRLFGQWINHRDKNLFDSLPDWLRHGLGQHLRFMVTSAGRARFKPDAVNRAELRDAVKADRVLPLRQLFLENSKPTPAVVVRASVPGYGITMDSFTLQAGSVVTWLLTKANRGKTKDLIPDYIGRLLYALKEAGGELPSVEGVDDPEERLKRLRARYEALQTRRDTIAKKAFEANFDSYEEADWKRLNRAWRAYAK